MVKLTSINPEICDNYGLLHSACKKKDYNAVKLYIEGGATVNLYDKDLNTPLHYCLMNYDFEIAKLLILNNAKCDAVNIIGLTPLDYWKKHPNFEKDLYEIEMCCRKKMNKLNKSYNEMEEYREYIQKYQCDISFHSFLKRKKIRKYTKIGLKILKWTIVGGIVTICVINPLTIPVYITSIIVVFASIQLYPDIMNLTFSTIRCIKKSNLKDKIKKLLTRN
jgi:hypothetical protein